MTIQTVPAFLQNASHAAALFRQADSASWVAGGILGAGELAVGAQSTPNMSVQIGAGRAMVAGSQTSAPTLLSGSTAAFTTQGMYFCLNDGPVTVTIAAANATNPRIDTVYLAVNDAFYSGSLNSAVLGVVTGIAAPSPVAPAAPSNALVLSNVAVAANATSIVTANVSSPAAVARSFAGHLPFFRYNRTTAFTWPTAVATMSFDSLVDGALEGMTVAAGVFTCQTPGVWEFDARAGITTGSGTGNTRWYKNGSIVIGFGAGQTAGAYVSSGGRLLVNLAAGDTISFAIITTTAGNPAGIVADAGTQLTWLTGRYVGLY